MTIEKSGGCARERRIEERSDCDIEAHIELGDRLAIACRVKNLSVTGVKIQIGDAFYLPDEFTLMMPIVDGIYQRHQVRLVWRKDEMVGGEFVTPIAP